jgi:hypothetical protein
VQPSATVIKATINNSLNDFAFKLQGISGGKNIKKKSTFGFIFIANLKPILNHRPVLVYVLF